jgi:uncharacterized protein YutE (UPF0331/DUF86 family)
VTELDRALVRRKLAGILRNLGDLDSVDGLSLGEFRSERFRQKGTERILQETVEAAVDVNLHVLRALRHPVPPDYFSSFVAMGERHLIPLELARALAPSTGLRNRLVHDYDEIDDQVVLDAVAMARKLFPEYVRQVEGLLGR